MKKRMVAVFLTIRGVVERVVLETQQTVNAKWYTEECLLSDVQSVKHIRPCSRAETWVFHQDNSPAHRSKVYTEYYPSSGLKVLEYPPYSSDLARFSLT
jgi:hypothetical protein